MIVQDPLNNKRYAAVDLETGAIKRGKADTVTDEIRSLIDREAPGKDALTNIEWAALRTMAGTRPVIVPVRRGGAWLYIERLDKRIYEIRVISPYSFDRGRAKLVTAKELAIVITKVRAKGSGSRPSARSP